MLRWFSRSTPDSEIETMAKKSMFAPPEELVGALVEASEVRQSFLVRMKILVVPEQGGMGPSDITALFLDWSARYSGPHLLEKLVKSVVLVVIPNLHHRRDASIDKYGCSFNGPISFCFSSESGIPTKFLEYDYKERLKNNGFPTYLSIQATFQPIMGSGPTIEDLFKESKGHNYYKERLPELLVAFGVRSTMSPKNQLTMH